MSDLLIHQIIAILSLIIFSIIVFLSIPRMKIIKFDSNEHNPFNNFPIFVWFFMLAHFFFILYELSVDLQWLWNIAVCCSIISYCFPVFLWDSMMQFDWGRRKFRLKIGLLIGIICLFLKYSIQKWFVWVIFIANSIYFCIVVIVVVIAMKETKESWKQEILFLAIALCIVVYLYQRYIIGLALTSEVWLWINTILIVLIMISAIYYCKIISSD